MGNAVNTDKRKSSGFNRFLNGVEVVGNKIPDPIILFVVLTLAIVVLS